MPSTLSPLFFSNYSIQPNSTVCAHGDREEDVQSFLYACAKQALEHHHRVLWITYQTELPSDVTQLINQSPTFHVLQKNRLSVLLEQPDVETFTEKWHSFCEDHQIDTIILDNVYGIASHQIEALQELFDKLLRFRFNHTVIAGSSFNESHGHRAIGSTVAYHTMDSILSIDHHTAFIQKNRYGSLGKEFTF